MIRHTGKLNSRSGDTFGVDTPFKEYIFSCDRNVVKSDSRYGIRRNKKKGSQDVDKVNHRCRWWREKSSREDNS